MNLPDNASHRIRAAFLNVFASTKDHHGGELLREGRKRVGVLAARENRDSRDSDADASAARRESRRGF